MRRATNQSGAAQATNLLTHLNFGLRSTASLSFPDLIERLFSDRSIIQHKQGTLLHVLKGILLLEHLCFCSLTWCCCFSECHFISKLRRLFNIMICCKNREPCFSKMFEGNCRNNDMKWIAYIIHKWIHKWTNEWLDEWVIMLDERCNKMKTSITSLDIVRCERQQTLLNEKEQLMENLERYLLKSCRDNVCIRSWWK